MNLQERVQKINNKIAKTNRASQDALSKAELYKQQLLEAIQEFKDEYGISLPTNFDSEETLKVIKDLYNTEYKRIEDECVKAEEVNSLIQEGRIAEAKTLLGYSDPVVEEEEEDEEEVSTTSEVKADLEDDLEYSTSKPEPKADSKEDGLVVKGSSSFDFEDEGEDEDEGIHEEDDSKSSKEDELVVKGSNSFDFEDEDEDGIEEESTPKTTPDGYKILGTIGDKIVIAYDDDDDEIFWKKSGKYVYLGTDTVNNKQYIGYDNNGNYVYYIGVEDLKESKPVTSSFDADDFFDDDF